MGQQRAEGGVAPNFGVPGLRDGSPEADGVTGGGTGDSEKEAGDPAPGMPHFSRLESEKKGQKGTEHVTCKAAATPSPPQVSGRSPGRFESGS